MLKFVCLALFVACASANGIQGSLSGIQEVRGPVPITACSGDPGSGTAQELRISGCDGDGCIVVPGTDTTVEGDFTPSVSASNAHFRGVAVVAGIPVPIAEGDLGPLQPNQQYRVTQVVRVSDALVGLTPIIRIEVTDGGSRIVCVETRVTIANP